MLFSFTVLYEQKCFSFLYINFFPLYLYFLLKLIKLILNGNVCRNSKGRADGCSPSCNLGNVWCLVVETKVCLKKSCVKKGEPPLPGLPLGTSLILSSISQCSAILCCIQMSFIEMGKHFVKHGDGAKDVAFEVEDCANLYKVRLYPGMGGTCSKFAQGVPQKNLFIRLQNSYLRVVPDSGQDFVRSILHNIKIGLNNRPIGQNFPI